MKTPTLSEIQARVPYKLRDGLTVRQKPYRCGACGTPHRIVGAENNLPQRNGTVKAVAFCPVCVANGNAVRTIQRAVKP